MFYFLPVQLLLLHFRKYQVLLFFWAVLFLTVSGNFATHFGASSLFLSPEYMGDISFISMFLLGGAMCVFIMTWHITTFIIHSKRIPYMGATRHAFVVYTYNNCIVPLLFLFFYSLYSVRFQWKEEHLKWQDVLWLQIGFYLGMTFIIALSFTYFFRVSRDFFKTILSKITNPARIRVIIPYDSLDYEVDIIPATSYITGRLRIRKNTGVEQFQPRLMETILRRHHRNVIFAALVAYLFLLLTGIFMEDPLLRVPAGCGFLLLFSMLMGVVGAFKYFLRSWEALGWILFVALMSFMVKKNLFDLRSIAYGLNYHSPVKKERIYDYATLRAVFSKERYEDDRKLEEARLQLWKNRNDNAGQLPPLVIVTVSGGGSRAAYWAFRSLQYADSVTQGSLFRHTVMITGASGGMIGAAYWRSLHDAWQQGTLKDPYSLRYQENVGKDLLNSIIFSLASVDLISPFLKVNVGGYTYTRDRGYAMEQEMARNTEGMLDKSIGYFKDREGRGVIPEMIINGTIVNDGRKLVICNQPAGFLTRPTFALDQPEPPIDIVDFATFFAGENPLNLRITTALRMNATFPLVLPVVRLPCSPELNIMDAGLSDNFGNEVAARYIGALHNWLVANTRKIIFLEIRDTRENAVCSISDQASLGSQLFDPLFVIQNKWEAFQSSSLTYLKDVVPCQEEGKLKYLTLQYVPSELKKTAELNFHLTGQEKDDIFVSIKNPENKAVIDTLAELLEAPKMRP